MLLFWRLARGLGIGGDTKLNIVIGYVQDRGDFAKLSDHVAHLRALGAQVVRVEEDIDQGGLLKPCLKTICDFLGLGDELLVPDLRHLGEEVDVVLRTVRRIEARGATLRLADPDASSSDPRGKAMIQQLEQLGPTGAAWTQSEARTEAGEVDLRAILALRAHGFGPTQIARKLGVSRMTVWRRLATIPEDA